MAFVEGAKLCSMVVRIWAFSLSRLRNIQEVTTGGGKRLRELGGFMNLLGRGMLLPGTRQPI